MKNATIIGPSTKRIDPDPDSEELIQQLHLQMDRVDNTLKVESPENKDVIRLLSTSLHSLDSKLESGENASRQIEQIFQLYVSRAYMSELFLLHISDVPYRVFHLIAALRSADFIEASSKIWDTINSATSTGIEVESREGKKLARQAGQLAFFIGQINIPESYELLVQYLRHPWPSVRSRGASNLLYWQEPNLIHECCNALLMGRGDPNAPKYSNSIFNFLAKTRNPTVIPVLESLLDTEFDRDDLIEGAPFKLNILRKCLEILYQASID